MNNRIKRILTLYFSSVIIYSIGLLIFFYLPYYQQFLRIETKNVILYVYLAYCILAPFYYLLFAKPYSENKPLQLLQATKRFVQNLFHRVDTISYTQKEKTALLFMLVKLFFLPLMLNFFFANYKHLLFLSDNFQWYPFMLTAIFMIDTLIFAFGYTFEFSSLKNKVKSVEPTFIGWAVALASYPPFNSMIGSIVPWGANEHVFFWNDTMTTLFRIIIITSLAIYLAATFALGPKASNLTNRGIVTRFPYSIVRHPAYVSKNIMWWLTLLPIINWQLALGMTFWTVIYVLRALTEERHLLMDPEYQAYCQKVKYRFIPYLI